MTDSSSTIDLRQYWKVFRARKLSVLVPVIIGVVLAGLYAKTEAVKYTAHATVRVDPLVALTGGAPQASLLDMATEQQTAASAAVVRLAEKTLGISTSPTDLQKNLKVAAAPTGNILLINYTSTSAAQAAKYANAFARAYLSYRSGPITRLITADQADIAGLYSQLPGAGQVQRHQYVAEIVAESTQLKLLEGAAKLSPGGAIISRATPPKTPSSPRTKRDVALGLAAGLVIGVCVALVREALDNRIRTREDLEARLGAPVLGVIPSSGRGYSDGALATLSDPRSATSDGYRVTATTLQFLAARDNLTVVMITTPRPGVQSAVTTANLGVALAQAGQQVILVSADMRSPTLHRIFGLSNEIGLSSARYEGRDATSLIQETAVPNLHVLASGPEPRNPAALLASPVTSEVIASLRAAKPDFILIAAPAVLATPDALVIAPRVDGTVIIWNASDSDAAALNETQERLATVGASILGAIYSSDQRKVAMSAAPPTFDTEEFDAPVGTRRRPDVGTSSNGWVEPGSSIDQSGSGRRVQ